MEEIYNIIARETITDQFDNIRIIKDNKYEYIRESNENYYIVDEMNRTAGLSKEYFYPIEEN